MAAAGVECVADVTGEAPVGFVEAVGHLGALRRAFRRLRSVIARPSPPRAVVLIDFPEFNLRLARIARRAGVPVIYFIPPQIWAWRPGRVRTIRRLVALVLAVFPFERALYQRAGVPVEFVGHPRARPPRRGAVARGGARERSASAPSDEVIGLLPGSRSGEIGAVLAVMRDAAALIGRARPRDALRAGPGPDGGRAVRCGRCSDRARRSRSSAGRRMPSCAPPIFSW